MNIDLIADNQIEISLDTLQSLEIELIKTPINIKGESAYEIAVRNGFIGNETEWLDSLQTGKLQWNSTNW